MVVVCVSPEERVQGVDHLECAAFFPPRLQTHAHKYTQKHACSHSNLVIASSLCLRAHVLYENTHTHLYSLLWEAISVTQP